jgi:hypothetical protein
MKNGMASGKRPVSGANLVTTSWLPKTYDVLGRQTDTATEKASSTYIVSRGADPQTGVARLLDVQSSLDRDPDGTVASQAERTADKHGLSVGEFKILVEAAHDLKRTGPTVHFPLRSKRGEDEREQRNRIRAFKKRITIEQARLGAKPYRLEVLEASPSLHAHLLAAVPTMAAANDIIATMDRSEFGPFLRKSSGEPASKRVYEWNGMVLYLLKEATPQAWAKGGKSFQRKKKAQRSGSSVTGDRVRLSKALENRLVGRGKIKPRRRTYASRLPQITTALAVESDSPTMTTPVQLAFALDAPVINVFDLVEARRQAEGESQRSLARRRFGVGQSQYANAKRGHDPLSPWVINRMLEYAKEGIAA